MPLYERLCDKIDPDFHRFRVILGFNQKSLQSQREQLRLLRSSLYQSKEHRQKSARVKDLSRPQRYFHNVQDEEKLQKIYQTDFSGTSIDDEAHFIAFC